MAELRRRLADFLFDLAEQIDPVPFFDDGEMDDRTWAGMLILHAEAVHDCEHTAEAREAIGMSGPRGEPVA